jgi:chemotaxis protein MotB
MRSTRHLPRRNTRSQEWVLGDSSSEWVIPLSVPQRDKTLHVNSRSFDHSPAFPLAAAVSCLLHLGVLFFLWQRFHPVTSEQEPPSSQVTEVEIVPLPEPVSTVSVPQPLAQPAEQNFYSSALSRAESLEHILTQAIAQRATMDAAQQQQLDSSAATQAALQSQVASLAEEKAELTAQLDNERQRNTTLTQHVTDIQQAQEKELQRVTGTYDRLVAALQDEVSQKDIALHQAEEKLTVTILDRVLFPSGQATLTPEGERLIEKVGAILAKVPGQRVLIEGHTDNVPIGAPLSMRFPSNWELSSARAAEVVKYLISHAQLSPQQLSAVGRADTSPVASNTTEEGRRFNRRIEIIVLPLDAESQKRS